MTGQKTSNKSDHAWIPLTVGFVTLCLLVGGLGYWSVTAKLAGAVVASGTVRVETNRQVIQHPEGGVVGEILVRDGDVVDAGDVLIRFDETRLQLEMNVVVGQLNELSARSTRLMAERDGTTELQFTEDFLAQAAVNPDVLEMKTGQERQFRTSLKAHRQEIELLDESVRQLENRVKGLLSQLKSIEKQREIVGAELAKNQDMLKRGLSTASKVTDLELEDASLTGQRGKVIAEIAEHKGQMASVNIERLRLETNRRRQAIQRSRDLQYSVIELKERQKELADALSQTEVRTPVSGVVYGSRIFALQSVVKPAEEIMYIVPQDQKLVVATRIDTADIDQVEVGQVATLRFTAFNQRQTPELDSRVVFVAADATVDQATGASYFVVELFPTPEEMTKLEGQVLLPGMPVEGFIKTDERTPLTYLAKPLTDYFERAFRG